MRAGRAQPAAGAGRGGAGSPAFLPSHGGRAWESRPRWRESDWLGRGGGGDAGGDAEPGDGEGGGSSGEPRPPARALTCRLGSGPALPPGLPRTTVGKSAPRATGRQVSGPRVGVLWLFRGCALPFGSRALPAALGKLYAVCERPGAAGWFGQEPGCWQRDCCVCAELVSQY